MWNDWTIGSFRAGAAVTPGPLGEAMKRFAADPRDEAAGERAVREPVLCRTDTHDLHPTRLTAGHADNALPQSATATVNCRIFLGVGFEPVRAALASVVGEGVEVRLTDEGVPSDASPMRKDVMAAVATAVHASTPARRSSRRWRPMLPTARCSAATASRPTASAASSSRTARVLARPERTRTGQAFMHGLTHWYVLIKELAGQ